MITSPRDDALISNRRKKLWRQQAACESVSHRSRRLRGALFARTLDE